jgi:hypothetical protein
MLLLEIIIVKTLYAKDLLNINPIRLLNFIVESVFPSFFPLMLKIEPRASQMLGKYTTELQL